MRKLSEQEKKQLAVYDTRKEQPSLWNLQAFVIVFLFIILGTTINVYSVNNDNLTWLDSNGDFKVNSYDHIMINLDTPLSTLNNQSLNDVFDVGNLLLHPTNWTFNQWTLISNLNNIVIAEITNPSGDYYGTSPLNFNNGDTFYTNIRAKASINNDISLYDRYTVHNITTDYQFYSSLGIRNFSIFNFGGNTTGSQVYIDTNYVPVAINLTDLGIDNLTQAQMDEYYDLYVNLQENRIEAYKQLGNEPVAQYQNLTQVLEVTIDAIMGPINNINDWINKFMQGLFS